MNYEDAIKLPASEKITLVTIESVERVKIFELDSGTYKRTVSRWVESVKDGSVAIVKASTKSLNENEFFYSPKTGELFVRLTGDANPKLRDISITYKHFFSNAPIILPNDLNEGEPVEWEPRVDKIGSLGQQLDDENTGIVLESSSNVSLENSDGYFDNIFDTLIWENQKIDFYSYIIGTKIEDIKKLFEGVIESKDFKPNQISFKVKDFVFKLKNKVSLGEFAEDDGRITDSILGTPKRRIYGQMKQVKTVGINSQLNGFQITGILNGTVDTVSISGVGTKFLSELSPEDELLVVLDDEEFKLGIQSIESDTALTLGSSLKLQIDGLTAINRTSLPYRYLNRRWHVAGHKLRQPESVITKVLSANRYEVDTTQDIFTGDQLALGSSLVSIRRISGNTIVTQNAIAPLPTIGQTFKKIPIQKVFGGSKEYIYSRDWTYLNSSESIIELNTLAEFNASEQRSLGVSLQFTNGSRTVSTSSVVDFRAILKPSDWIRKDSNASGENTWHEILAVSEQSLTLRIVYTGTTEAKQAKIKTPEYLDDDSLVTCDCLGMEVDGRWIKTPSDAVRHLLLNDALFPSVNEASFAKANADCDHILSMVIPANIGSSEPDIRTVITQINESVFGSLYGDTSSSISYSILNANKPEITTILRDDDIISFSMKSNQKIANEVQVNYKPFVDIFTGESTFEKINFKSNFVDNLIGIKNKDERIIYLFEDDKAEIIAQRISLFNQLSSATVEVKGKANLSNINVNDKVFLSLDRLYKRFAGKDKRKIGTVTGVKKDGFNVDVSFTDLGGIYNRVMSIAPDSTPSYSLASEDDAIQWGFILDNESETPDPLSETLLGSNIIG